MRSIVLGLMLDKKLTLNLRKEPRKEKISKKIVGPVLEEKMTRLFSRKEKMSEKGDIISYI